MWKGVNTGERLTDTLYRELREEGNGINILHLSVTHRSNHVSDDGVSSANDTMHYFPRQL